MGARRAVRTTVRGWSSGMVGATPPVRAWRVATRERAGMVVRKGGPRRMDLKTEAGLRVRVQRDHGAGRCVTPASRAMSRAWARSTPFKICLALFERVFLQIFEPKCANS
jgi:hypothetical protein